MTTSDHIYRVTIDLPTLDLAVTILDLIKDVAPNARMEPVALELPAHQANGARRPSPRSITGRRMNYARNENNEVVPARQLIMERLQRISNLTYSEGGSLLAKHGQNPHSFTSRKSELEKAGLVVDDRVKQRLTITDLGKSTPANLSMQDFKKLWPAEYKK